jgi:hypothetical protein
MQVIEIDYPPLVRQPPLAAAVLTNSRGGEVLNCPDVLEPAPIIDPGINPPANRIRR